MQLRRLAPAVALLGATATGLVLPSAVPAASAAGAGNFHAIAHRGYHRHYTENTIDSLRAARRLRATAVEADIRLTRDRKFVVMHDPTLRRTTTCRGAVARRTQHWIHRHCRAEDGARVPSAASLLRQARHRNMNLVLEIKPDPRHRWSRHRFRALNHLIRQRHMRHRVMILSRNAGLLRREGRLAHWLPTVYIARGRPTVHRVTSTADRVTVDADHISRKLVRRMHRAGVPVYGRHSNSRRDWRRYRRAGVDGVLTDRVRRYLRWRRTH